MTIFSKRVIISSLLIVLVIVILSCIQFQFDFREVETSDSVIAAVARDTKMTFLSVDRCDPLPCFDHFQVVMVRKVQEPIMLINTGGAGLQTAPSSDLAVSRATIIESTKRVLDNSDDKVVTYKNFYCVPGNYLVDLVQRNWLYIVKDHMRLCYSMLVYN